MPPSQAWQRLAKSFELTASLVRGDRLPVDFEPADAISLFEEPISTHERSILSFLLHVWNHYDFPFDLSEVAMWSPEHQRAFCGWASGQTLGKPCRYF